MLVLQLCEYSLYITAETSFKHVALINSLFHPSSRYKYNGAVVIVNSKEPFSMILRQSWLMKVGNPFTG